MATHVILQHPITKETKAVKVGFSWVLFFFSFMSYGTPLFLREMHHLGAVVAGLMLLFAVGILSQPTVIDALTAILLCSPITFGIELWLGIKGNEMTVKNYLQKGWRFLEPDSVATKHARYKWGLPEISEQQVDSLETSAQRVKLPKTTPNLLNRDQ